MRRLVLWFQRIALVALLAPGSGLCANEPPGWLESFPLGGPCAGQCGVALYAGRYVEDSMSKVLLRAPEFPHTWDYGDSGLVGFAVSRRVARAWGRIDLEPELGLARRFGDQDEAEAWAAVFLRYRGFPWDGVVTTSFALSTGFNYATGISDVEQERARDGEGSRLMHYFSPELTFALPSQPDRELLMRFHHRSGVFGLVSDAWGGAQYLSFGLRLRF